MRFDDAVVSSEDLRARGHDGLTALLHSRPEVLFGAAPRDLAELAQRLNQPESLLVLLERTPLPYLQVAEALQALGGSATDAELAGLLAGDDEGAVVRIADGLVEWAAASRSGDRVLLPRGYGQLLPRPLGLGPPLTALLAEVSVDDMRRIERTLRLPQQRNRAATVAALQARLGDVDWLRTLLVDAPAEIVQELMPGAGDGGGYDPVAYQRRQAAVSWAEPRGLIFAQRWGYGWQVPAEVGIALRGADYRAPFDPEPPTLPAIAVDRGWVESDSAAAATAFAGHALAVLDHLVRVTLPAARSGGVGVRELTRLAKSAAAGEAEVRLVLELAWAAGLLEHGGDAYVVADPFGDWRDAEPADRYAALLTAWWELGHTPTAARDGDGKALRALLAAPPCAGCRSARHAVLASLADIEGGCDPLLLTAAVHWRRPMAHAAAQDGDRPFATVLAEASMLGVVAQGALTDLGRSLLAGSGIEAQAGRLLPQSADIATFGADLTVYVAGAPSARVSTLLDASADRESRGGAVTWRFSPASVRRALDDGRSAQALAVELAAISSGPLPQPLEYLLADVGRRHGHLRVLVGSVIVRSDDEALLREVAVDRRLARLGLRMLAPSVLVGEADTDQTLAALRKAGYLPVLDDAGPAPADGEPDLGRSGGVVGLVRPARSAPRQLDARAVAGALLAGRSGPAAGVTERLLDGLARRLSTSEVRQLAHAIDAQARVSIVYESGAGNRTQQIVDRLELSGRLLYGWCELRGDDRWFTVDRICAVQAVGG